MTVKHSRATSSVADSALPALPAILALWLQERGFDVCPWYEAPNTARKIIGKDAWRFGDIELSRAPIGTDTLRYYVALCPKRGTGKSDTQQMVGYWLEIHKLPLLRARAPDSGAPL